ncbi:MAG: flavin-containing monooxygenase [Acidimicrobiales bacterium]
MTDTQTAPTTAGSPPAEVDILIVGAGISGIGAAYHLLDQRPGTSFCLLENQDGFGGTWKTHKYPGIRSDSDLFTFGYRFKPWMGDPIATADKIMTYLEEVIDEHDIGQYIHYGHQVDTASWDSASKRWLVKATGPDGPVEVSAGFVWMCQGYYRHSEGYTPTWEGMDDFDGEIVHPQTWPDDLDYAGKKVVVIGSGATAATLIPAMAPDVEHITMLQRSPTYFFTARNSNELANSLREIEIDPMWIHEIVRRRTLFDQNAITHAARDFPDLVKEELFNGIKEHLGDDLWEELKPHFTPHYRPWRQRIAFVPDGDLFLALKEGSASVVTDTIDRFVPEGIRLGSGETLEADIVVTATGFDMSVLGDIAFDLDGEVIDFADRVTYRGLMFDGVPNLSWIFGYFRASWTLRVDIVADFLCRLFEHMEKNGNTVVMPSIDDGTAADMTLGPWVDPEDFNPGYLTRSMHLLPKQGDRDPWRHSQDYWTEKETLPLVDLDEPGLRYS